MCPQLERPARAQPSLDVLRHVVDVHCHPTDSEITAEAMDNLEITICAMSSRQSDQPLVWNLAYAYPQKIVPCFGGHSSLLLYHVVDKSDGMPSGYHPWFSHRMSTIPYASREEHYRQLFSPSDDQRDLFEKLLPHLPDPVPLADVLAELRRNLSSFPRAMLGEVGLDRAARIPIEYSSTPRELTPFIVPLEHQLVVLESQIDLAVELGRNVSMHSVKCPQATLDLLDRMHQKHGSKWLRISFDLHSCGLSAETWRAIQNRHVNVFMSLSTVINGRSSNHRALIEACSPSRILVESDYHPVEECAQRTWDMVLTVAEIKGWPVETIWEEDLDEENWGVVRRLEQNWREFQNGNHSIPSRSKKTVRQTH